MRAQGRTKGGEVDYKFGKGSRLTNTYHTSENSIDGGRGKTTIPGKTDTKEKSSTE